MKHRLSFAYFNILSENILEVVVDDGIEMTLEMIEECHDFIDAHFTGNFALLINRLNSYDYSYEAKLSIASYTGLKAIAFVYYNNEDKQLVEKLHHIRKHDQWNCQIFAGLTMGRQQAFNWLQEELSLIDVK